MAPDGLAPDMTTSVRVSSELADELFERKRRGESYEDVIWRLIDKADKFDERDNRPNS